MVLDYSKVDAFTKHLPGERLNVRPHVVKGGIEPLLSTYSYVNLAAIAEEVIEGTCGGRSRCQSTTRLDSRYRTRTISTHHHEHLWKDSCRIIPLERQNYMELTEISSD
jgi:hypothetical protein